MNSKVKKLAALTSQGDEEAASELAREFLRGGYLEVEGKPQWVIKDLNSGLFWGNSGWSEVPHLYAKGWAKNRAKKISVSKYERHREIFLLEVRYTVLQKEPLER